MNERLSNEKTPWQAIGPMYRYDDIRDVYGVDPHHIIVLRTKNGTEVCPARQFVEFTGGWGEITIKTSPYVYFGWRLMRLSGLTDWSNAAGFFAPQDGQDRSYSEMLSDLSLSDEDKKNVMREMFADETDRSGLEGDGRFESAIRDLAEELGVLFNDELPQGGE